MSNPYFEKETVYGTIPPYVMVILEYVIASDPININWGTCSYFLRFYDNATVQRSGLDWYIPCWWNDRGCTYRGYLWVTPHTYKNVLRTFNVLPS